MTQQRTPESGSPAISCAEFQEQLPELFASGSNGIPDDPIFQAHLDTCDNCSALVRDLQYIASEARRIFDHTEEPSDNLWDKISAKMTHPDPEEDVPTKP